jgi:PIN domain nuclease of toxin-antitoxin system
MPKKGGSSMSNLLLDTCAVLWLAQGAAFADEARKAISDGKIAISPITAWEIANLVRKKRIILTMPVVKWFRQTADMIEATMPELTLDILAGSCELPGSPPSDPADRIIIATAREGRMVLVTRDKRILDYSHTGYVQTMAC